MSASLITFNGQIYSVDAAGVMTPVVEQAPEVEYITVNGVKYIEQADGTLVPAGAVPVAQVAPKRGGGKVRPAASPKASTARTPKAKSNTWTIGGSETEPPRARMIASCLYHGMTPAQVAKLQKGSARQASEALGKHLVAAGKFTAIA